MQSIRITMDQKRAIARQAAEDTYNKRITKAENRRPALCKQIYNALLTPGQRRTLKSLPPSFFNYTTGLEFNYQGKKIFAQMKEKKPVPMDLDPDRYRGHRNIVKSIPAVDALIELDLSIQSMEEKRTKLRRSIVAQLENVRTTKKLVEVWPEGQKYYKNLLAGLPCTDLAIRFEDINAEIFGKKKA